MDLPPPSNTGVLKKYPCVQERVINSGAGKDKSKHWIESCGLNQVINSSCFPLYPFVFMTYIQYIYIYAVAIYYWLDVSNTQYLRILGNTAILYTNIVTVSASFL